MAQANPQLNPAANPGSDDDNSEESEAESEEMDKVDELQNGANQGSNQDGRDDQSMFDADIRNEPYGSETSRRSRKRTARQMGIPATFSKSASKKLKI